METTTDEHRTALENVLRDVDIMLRPWLVEALEATTIEAANAPVELAVETARRIAKDLAHLARKLDSDFWE